MKIAIEDIRTALEATNGQPVAAAKRLNVDYSSLWRRIRSEPELMEIQKAARSRAFQELENITTFAARTGYMQKTILDADGKLTNQIELVPIDERTRVDLAFRLMNLFKADAGIVDEVSINASITASLVSVPVSKWIEANTDPAEE